MATADTGHTAPSISGTRGLLLVGILLLVAAGVILVARASADLTASQTSASILQELESKNEQTAGTDNDSSTHADSSDRPADSGNEAGAPAPREDSSSHVDSSDQPADFDEPTALGNGAGVPAPREDSSSHVDSSDQPADFDEPIALGNGAGVPAPREDMPVTYVDGTAYIGSLTLPTLDLQVPVARNINDELLGKSPCCYRGSYLTDDLVICGQGYDGHFGRISSLGIGDSVVLHSVAGEVHPYIVSNVENEPLEDMDKVLPDWDLTLFTFNADGTCCIVRCVTV